MGGGQHIVDQCTNDRSGVGSIESCLDHVDRASVVFVFSLYRNIIGHDRQGRGSMARNPYLAGDVWQPDIVVLGFLVFDNGHDVVIGMDADAFFGTLCCGHVVAIVVPGRECGFE